MPWPQQNRVVTFMRQGQRIRVKDNNSLVVIDHFIQATRDSGYKGTPSAIAELVDNAIQAGATRVVINIAPNEAAADGSLHVEVVDNGSGMDSATLQQALRFGGSTNFNDRHGLGRYGMGLPNSSFSQTRRVEVYTWRSPRSTIASFLDVDEIIAGRLTRVPNPIPTSPPKTAAAVKFKSGTAVAWNRCDRLDHRRPATIAKKLHPYLGRVFRYFLWDGVQIEVNGEQVRPVDPLFLHERSLIRGGRAFGSPLNYDIKLPLPNERGTVVGQVIVTFSELPVEEWHHLSNKEKNRLGVSNAAGVSIVRARREIDYSWFFMGDKRKENYDDWWRCEIRFEPDLDEYFGVTHIKQQISPTAELLAILTPDIEAIAHKLNATVRQKFTKVRNECGGSATKIASQRDRQLRPIPGRKGKPFDYPVHNGLRYRLKNEPLDDESFYTWHLVNEELIIILNRDHPFFDRIYRPLMGASGRDSRFPLDCLLLAMARAEASATTIVQKHWYEQKRTSISNVLAAFLGG
jgi:hypothetical protein